ncbi:MAG: glycosyltransferase [Chloroflexi bacterium]|nr:glycosyltransferase [Chloroflexota bacterium]
MKITDPNNHEPSAGKPPRVSIGIPTYNGARYIRRALDSLLAQTHQDFEIIISDNASTDETAVIIHDYMQKDGRIRYTRNDVNRGATYNYNHVLALARGEYFKWMADDDVIHPQFIEKCVDELGRDRARVLVYAKAAFIDQEDRVLYRFDDVMKLDPWSPSVVKRTGQMMQAIFRNGSAANVIVFGVVRTEALRAIRPLGNYFGPDFTIVTELALLGPIYEIPKLMLFYRRHQASSSTYKKSPSAASQQQFLDPGVTNRFRQELQLRRRYFEVFRAILIAKLPVFDKIRIACALVYLIVKRLIWRVGFELRYAMGRIETTPLREPDPRIGLHWSDYSRS